MKLRVLLLFLTLFVGIQSAVFADTADSSKKNVDLGLNADNAEVSGKDADEVNRVSLGVQRGTRILVKDFGQSIIANFWDYLGNLCLKMMFYVYDNYIGSFLLYIPDMSNKATYQKAGAPDPGGAVRVVSSLLMVSRAIGMWFLLVLTVAYIAQGASGLSNVQFSGRQILRFIICFTLLCAWSPIFSLLTQLFTAIAYSFYTACTLNTGGVFKALTDFTITDGTASNGSSAIANTAMTARATFVNYTGIVWNVVYTVAIALIVAGIIAAFMRLSSGDKGAVTKIWLAFSGLVVILALPWALNLMVAKGFPNLGASSAADGSSYSLFNARESFHGTAKATLPAVTSGPTFADSGAKTKDKDASEDDENEAGTIALGAAGIFKVIMSIWGLFIVVGVLFMKFGQVILLGVLFVLGPVFIGLAAHPTTASISMGALKLLIKCLAYSPMWALTLVFLYLIPNVDFGVANMGVNSLMTAFAVFAGLQMISDAKDIAGLFSSFGGGGAAGGNFQPRSPIMVLAGDLTRTSGQFKSAGKEIGGLAKGAANVASGIASGGSSTAAKAGTEAVKAATNSAKVSMGKASGASAGALSPESYVTPRNIDNYIQMMSGQPASQANVAQIDRVLSARSRGHDVTPSDEKANRLSAVRGRMTSELAQRTQNTKRV